jgi:hypothetical protein
MAGDPSNSTGLRAGEKIALLVSLGSLLISAFSLWESHLNRRSTEETAQRTERLSEKLARPWAAVADLSFSGLHGAETGISFAFKNSGSSPALDLKVTPCVTLDTNETPDLAEAEKDGTMDAGTVPAGESRAVMIPLDDLPAMRRVIEGKSPLRYAVSWTYGDVYGNKHPSRQFGHWDKPSQMFTIDTSETH